jgi:hypothetical protein
VRFTQATHPIRSLPSDLQRFRAVMQEVQDGLSTKDDEGLAKLMTLRSQQIEDVSLVAPCGIIRRTEFVSVPSGIG